MTKLTEGSKAPAFSGTDQNGNTISLAGLKGTNVVLYFYPKDDTPTCTVQACNLKDNYAILQNQGFTVIGISPDDEKMHKKFEQKYSLPFSLIADVSHTIINKYDVWGPKLLYGKAYMGLHRTTFLINKKGIIVKIFAKPKSKIHTAEILEAWATINK